jgi:asparagine synthetase B (glutamine-hydrolysing)
LPVKRWSTASAFTKFSSVSNIGHARLSIIDLETGDQPIPNEDHRLHIVANGAFLQDTLRSATLDRPGIYDRTRVSRLLDALPSMTSTEERQRADMTLMWMTSLCVLADRFGL